MHCRLLQWKPYRHPVDVQGCKPYQKEGNLLVPSNPEELYHRNKVDFSYDLLSGLYCQDLSMNTYP